MPDAETHGAHAIRDTDMATPHRYSIWPKDPAAHLFEVRLTVADPDSAGQIFAMPAWIPGSYMIRDYAKHVVTIRAESDGLDVPLTKLDKSRWRAVETERELTLILEIFAHDESVRGAHLDTTHAFLNGTCVFPAIVGQEELKLGLLLNLVDPGIGGFLIRGPKGTGKSTAVHALARLMPLRNLLRALST